MTKFYSALKCKLESTAQRVICIMKRLNCQLHHTLIQVRLLPHTQIKKFILNSNNALSLESIQLKMNFY